MHVSVEQYDEMPAEIIDWDLELETVENRVHKALAERERR